MPVGRKAIWPARISFRFDDDDDDDDLFDDDRFDDDWESSDRGLVMHWSCERGCPLVRGRFSITQRAWLRRDEEKIRALVGGQTCGNSKRQRARDRSSATGKL